MISENSRKHYSAHVPHSKALNCTNDYVELYTSLCSQLGLRPNTAVGVSLRQYEVNTCMDSLSEMDVVPLAALLAKARLLTSVQFWGKKFQMAVQQPELSVCVSTPGGSLPTTSRSRDKLEYARRTYKFPNEQDKSLSEIHEDPGTVCNSRNIEQTIKLMKGLSRNLQTGGILRQLRLVGLKFGKESVNQLAEGLKDNRSLDYLCINYCRLTDKRFAVLANSLCTAVKLRKLDLAHNDLEDLCGFHLGRMIGKNAERKDEAVWAYGLRGEQLALDLDEGLQDVCLANNKVSDRDIFDLGRVLYCDAYMRVLDLRRNRLSPQGINEVLSIVASNNSLLMVDIRENALEERSEDFLKVGYKITTKLMRNLKTLKSSGVAMNPDWEAKLSEYQIAYFSPSESAIEHRVFSSGKESLKLSSSCLLGGAGVRVVVDFVAVVACFFGQFWSGADLKAQFRKDLRHFLPIVKVLRSAHEVPLHHIDEAPVFSLVHLGSPQDQNAGLVEGLYHCGAELAKLCSQFSLAGLQC